MSRTPDSQSNKEFMMPRVLILSAVVMLLAPFNIRAEMLVFNYSATVSQVIDPVSGVAVNVGDKLSGQLEFSTVPNGPVANGSYFTQGSLTVNWLHSGQTTSLASITSPLEISATSLTPGYTISFTPNTATSSSLEIFPLFQLSTNGGLTGFPFTAAFNPALYNKELILEYLPRGRTVSNAVIAPIDAFSQPGTVQAAPEPGSLTLLLLGASGIASAFLRRRMVR
jgi:hypothetical protein